MKDRNLWIWGLHSVEAALECFPDLVLELKVEEAALKGIYEEGEVASPLIAQRLQALVEGARSEGISCEVVRELPKDYREKRAQGCVALMKRAPSLGPRDLTQMLSKPLEGSQPRQWALLDRIEDPRNFGAILRSAAAFGLAGVFYSDRQQAPVTGVVAQASAGQCFRVPLFEFPNLNLSFKLFEEQGLKVCVAALDMEGESLEEFAASASQKGVSDVIWLLGSEGRGLRAGLLERATQRVSIPMQSGVESLNVSVASALAFYSLFARSGK